jgi:hypothetical protein
MARLPLITLRRDIDVRVVNGQSIFELYQQIQILLQRESSELANFFAEPIVNAIRGEIAWNTRVVGNPRLAANLSSAEWSQVSQLLNKKIELVNQLLLKLEKAGLGNSASSEALRGMLMTPNIKESLFQIGEDLVLAQWGCYEFGTDARSADLYEQIERLPKITLPTAWEAINPPVQSLSPEELPPTVTEVTPSTTPPPIPNATELPPETNDLGESSPIPTSEHPQVVAEPRSRLWRWLLLLILLLLLLIGIFWKYFQTNGPSSEAVLRAEIAELWQKVDKKARECGLIPPSSGDSSAANQVPVTNEEFKDRQNENSINPGSKLNVSLAWRDRADLDLYVKQPDGQIVFFKPCTSADCGTLDVDANRCDPRYPCDNLKERPLENISWSTKMQRGKYIILVGLYSQNRPSSEIQAVPFTVQVTKDGKPVTYQGIFRREDMNCTDICSANPRPITEFTIE